MLSEAALSLMQGRRLEGMRTKARRGDLLHPPPMGYVRGPDGDDQRDPDEQAHRVVRLIFAVCEPQGRLHGLLRSLVAHDRRVPIRPHAGLNRGPLAWRRPTRMT
jgi:DNA invertase Pin-like site-specific DNA recombinase